MLLSGCGTAQTKSAEPSAVPASASESAPIPTEIILPEANEQEVQFEELSDDELLDYVENAVYKPHEKH